MSVVTFDMSEYREFFRRMERAARGDFRAEFELYIEAVGSEFLRILQDEIVRRKVIDTRLLLASFERGADGNIWNLSDGGLTLEVGTNLEYAAFVNDGHWTNPRGVARRWVPGYWEGDRFIYDPQAKTGMALKQHWVEGAHYFEGPLRAFEPVFKASAEAKLHEWMQKYFEGV